MVEKMLAWKKSQKLKNLSKSSPAFFLNIRPGIFGFGMPKKNLSPLSLSG